MPLYLALTVMTPLAARMTKKNTPIGSRRDYLNRMVLFTNFAALFLTAALRGAVGNDYDWYTVIMHEASVHGMVPTEAGFNAIVYLLYALFGFENYRFVFALFSGMTVLFFLIWLWRESEDFAFSFTLFMLSGCYFQAFSTVRYYVALPFVLLSFRYCMKRDLPRFVLMVLLGSLMHKSVLIVLLFYPLASIYWKKIPALIGLIAAIGFRLFPDFWMEVALRLYPSYQKAPFMGDESSPLNIVRCLLAVLPAIYVMRHELHEDLIFNTKNGQSVRRTTGYPGSEADRKDTSGSEMKTDGYGETLRKTSGNGEAYLAAYIRMSVMALIMYVCASFLPQLSRLAFYLTVPQFLLLPALVNRVANPGRRRAFRALILAFFALVFLRYMLHAADDGIRVLPYTSFLFE